MTIRIRRDTAANWTTANPVLSSGQPGYETDTGRVKIGDGVTAWNSLVYRFESASAAWGSITGTLSAQTDLNTALNGKQATLVSATNIKTINGASILGSGDLAISGGGGVSDGDKGDITVSGSGATWTIDAGAVTVSKMANLASSTILGNNTGGAAAPIALSAAQVKTLLAIAAGDVSGLAAIATSGSAADLSAGTLPAARFDDTAHGSRAGGTLHANAVAAGAAGFMTGADKTKLDAITGTNTGDVSLAGSPNYLTLAGQVITRALIDLASHVTGKLPLANLADMATGSVFYRKTAGTGAPEVQTLATLKTDLGLTGTNSGDQTITLTGMVTGSGTGSFAASLGSFTKAQLNTAVSDGDPLYVGDVTTNATHTGDVTGATALTIANDAVTNAKAANMATATIKGRTTAGTGDPEDLTGTQATALLDTFTSGAKGLVPASGGGTANFLRADGTFAAPPGGGGSPGGSSGEVQYNNAGAFAGAADVEIEGGQLRLPSIATPSVPAAGGAKLYATDLGGIPWPAFSDSGSFDPTRLMDHLAFGKTHWFMPVNGTTTFVLGFVVSAQGTATTARLNTGSRRVRLRRIEYLVTTPSTSAVASLRDNIGSFNEGVTIGGSNAWEGGFYSVQHWGPATGASISTHRAFCGLRDNSTATDVEPSTLFNIVGMGWDAADANVQFMHNDGAGAATKIDLGASFPVPSADRADTYRLEMYSPPGTTQSVSYRVTRLESGAVATGTVTTNLPLNTQGLGSNTWMSVGGTSSVIGIAAGPSLIRTEY